VAASANVTACARRHAATCRRASALAGWRSAVSADVHFRFRAQGNMKLSSVSPSVCPQLLSLSLCLPSTSVSLSLFALN
jgi:hypothetical protein